ncbi:MAG TPA: calcium/proton exchanger [Capsulimonadaceae bacterium]|nr:calcium/proton exchanger [Capsulimonadaceae bacterium]
MSYIPIKRVLSRNLLLAFLPVSAVLALTSRPALWVFLTAGLAIVPLAGLIGDATEELAKHLGAQWGGLLNATFGNVTELIIGLFALHAGLLPLVRASIIGSVLGNILLVLGAAVLAGGIRYKIQTFNQEIAESHSINLVLATIALAVPAIFAISFGINRSPTNPGVAHLSLSVSILLLLIYIASLWFSLYTHENLFRGGEEEETEPPCWTKRKALLVLALATVGVAVESEWLVQSVRGATQVLGVNEVFVGIILVPIIGNAAEHSTAVMLALKNKMDITMNITIGSSIQVAMFVAPVLVIASLWLGHPMSYIFSVPELTSIALAVLIAAFIASDGKTHWLEGAQLLAAYAIIAAAFYFLPAH